MKRFIYQSGEEVKSGDRIAYHDSPGTVEFVAAEKTGDAAQDWYVDRFTGGGLMIVADGFGHVFLTAGDIDEDLQLVARADAAQGQRH